MSDHPAPAELPPQKINAAEAAGNEPIRVPQYRRDITPRNLVLSADDVQEFCELLVELNERAKAIELSQLNMANFSSPAEAKQRVDDFVVVEYTYNAENGDSVQGIGIPNVSDRSFPDDLGSFFVSNASYAVRAVNVRPLNCVEAFLGFEKPSLKIDLLTLPSNPTENRSIINVMGRDEAWVISASEKIQSFLKKRSTFRPVIHASGAYDYFIYLVYLPICFWLIVKHWRGQLETLSNLSTLFSVMLGVYLFLLLLLAGRFLFQYFRWLFPPMEFYKRSRWKSYLHRSVAGLVLTGLVLNTIYDLLRSTIMSSLP